MRHISGEPEALTNKQGKKHQNKLLYMKKITISSTRSKSTNTTENGWTVGLIQDISETFQAMPINFAVNIV